MTAIRIRTTLESDTLHLPELKPLIGQTVEITVQAKPDPAVREEFYTVIGRVPDTEEEWAGRQAKFRAWRSDPRFAAYWPTLDHILESDFTAVRRWKEVAKAAQALRESGYDFDAWREQREFDRLHAYDHLP
jgi:hypothetical protein